MNILSLALYVTLCTALFLLTIPIAGFSIICRAISRGTEYVADWSEALAIALLQRAGF